MKHGGDLAEARARYGGEPEDWLDLSTGINPHPYPLPAFDPQAWTRLPSQSDARTLEEVAAEAYGAPPSGRVVPAPGAQALIQWLPRLAPPGAAAILVPTYSEHAAAWRAAGRVVHAVRDHDAIPMDARHVVVVNPNNPDGRVVARATLQEFAEACAARGGWLVVDESFADLDPDVSVIPDASARPVVVLRSFGKFYGLAGVRLGFAAARPDIAESIAGALGPWAVSGPALAVGRQALADAAWAAMMRARLAGEARALDAVLARGGLDLVGGTALYRLVRYRDAARLHDRLARARIWVRRFDWADDLVRFGLPGSLANLDRLAATLANAHR